MFPSIVFCDFFFLDASHVELGKKEMVKAALCYVFPETQDTNMQASWGGNTWVWIQETSVLAGGPANSLIIDPVLLWSSVSPSVVENQTVVSTTLQN